MDGFLSSLELDEALLFGHLRCGHLFLNSDGRLGSDDRPPKIVVRNCSKLKIRADYLLLRIDGEACSNNVLMGHLLEFATATECLKHVAYLVMSDPVGYTLHLSLRLFLPEENFHSFSSHLVLLWSHLLFANHLLRHRQCLLMLPM